MTSGKGQLLCINQSPVNLTLVGPEIWVTESQIRHRLIPGEAGNIPDRFFIRRFGL